MRRNALQSLLAVQASETSLVISVEKQGTYPETVPKRKMSAITVAKRVTSRETVPKPTAKEASRNQRLPVTSVARKATFSGIVQQEIVEDATAVANLATLPETAQKTHQTPSAIGVTKEATLPVTAQVPIKPATTVERPGT